MAVIGSSTPIKSIQRGSATLYSSGAASNVTINAVVLDKSFVSISNKSGYYAGRVGYNSSTIGNNSISVGGTLTGTTTLALTGGLHMGWGWSVGRGVVYWEVIEYE
jgi:hypothetical protein